MKKTTLLLSLIALFSIFSTSVQADTEYYVYQKDDVCKIEILDVDPEDIGDAETQMYYYGSVYLFIGKADIMSDAEMIAEEAECAIPEYNPFPFFLF